MEDELYNKEKLILQRLSGDEKARLERKLTNDQSGCGTIYNGKHYCLEYRPSRDPFTLKCTGVKLVIVHTNNRDLPASSPRYIPFKPGIIFNKAPYKERLEEMVAHMTKDVQQFDESVEKDLIRKQNEKEERAAAIEAHAEKVMKCQLKIDATMRAIVPKINTQQHQTEYQTVPEENNGHEININNTTTSD
jgi:hypothetical protein